MRTWMVLLIVALVALGVGIWWLLENETPATEAGGPAEAAGADDLPPLSLKGMKREVDVIDRRIDEAMANPQGPARRALPTNARRVDVRLPDGTQPPIALIRYAPDRHAALFEPTSTPWSPDLGSISVRPDDEYALAETLDGLVSKAVRLKTDGVTTLQVRAPKGGGRLVGKIVLPDGLQVHQPMVVAALVEGTDPGRPQSVMEIAGGNRARTNEEANGYDFRSLPAGRYQVALSLNPFGEVDDWFLVDLTDRLVRRDVKGDLQLRPVVEVFVYGADGQLDKGARLQTSYEAPKISSTGGVTLRRADGVFLIRHDRMWDPRRRRWLERHPEGVFRVAATTEAGTQSQAYDPNRSDPIVFRFAQATRLELRLEGLPESLPGDLSLELRPRTRGESGVMSSGGTRLTKGRAELPSVQPGDYEACLIYIDRADGAAFTLINVERFPVHVAPGGDVIEQAMPALHEVRIKGADPKLGAIELHRIDEHGAWTHQIVYMRNAPKAFRLVPPGRYEVRVSLSRTENKTWPLEVPRQLEIDLR